MSVVIGIDCGYRTGGVALVGDRWAEVHDLPVLDNGVDVLALMDILTSVDDVSMVILERQQAMPRQGSSSTFKLGVGYGQIQAAAALSRSPWTTVSPSVWKRSMNLPRDKDSARRLAIQMWPDLHDRLRRKKDEHRAEALLIGTYWRGTAT